jgi:hypothetical protein
MKVAVEGKGPFFLPVADSDRIWLDHRRSNVVLCHHVVADHSVRDADIPAPSDIHEKTGDMYMKRLKLRSK